jgi:catechol 2,3-dioxygenase-like lactoylglutathione lyase family enzyme
MKVTGFNHLSIGTKNLAESVKFYETVLGMQTIPSYNFGFKTKYLRRGDLSEEGLAAWLYLDQPHLEATRRAR